MLIPLCSILQDDEHLGSGDSDGSVNNIRLFTCEKNNGMFVNIGQLTVVPPKRPMRKPKRKPPSTPSMGSGKLTNGSHLSDILTNDLVSQTESELSFTDDVSAETAPLVNFHVNDRVIWPSENGYEAATVKWIGTLAEEEALRGEILVGVEFVSLCFYCKTVFSLIQVTFPHSLTIFPPSRLFGVGFLHTYDCRSMTADL